MIYPLPSLSKSSVIMGEVNFYLKKPAIIKGEKPAAKGSSQIYLQFKYNGKRLRFQFGQSIDAKNWNENKQRVKSNKQTTTEGDHSLNDLLDNLEEVCIKAYKDEIKNGIPNPSKLREHLIRFLNQNSEKEKKPGPDFFSLMQRFIDGEIKTSQGRNRSKGSLNNYRSVKIHLKGFEIAQRCKINFESINLDFFYKYTSYLEKTLALSVNTVAKDIRLIKVLMAEAVDLGYTNNLQFKHRKFTYAEEEIDAVYLTDKEIINLYKHDFSRNKKHEGVRDLFVFGCFVGLRYSDYSTVKLENIISIENENNELEYYLKKVTSKTKELVIIPCNPIVIEIFNKYEDNPNRLPKSISNQKFNEYIKEACRSAGLTQTGKLSTDPQKELCECIGSHTARRSFATNLYLEGYPTIDIMKATGHKSEKSFLKYIKVSKLDSAKRLNDHIKRNWEDKLRKAERSQPSGILRVAS